MKIDWDNIVYFFQIPKKWFQSLQDKVYKAYGENFIRVDVNNGREGGLEIGIDRDLFEQEVREIASEIPEGAGTVKSVDGLGPDDNGNVALGALTASDITTQGEVVGPTYTGQYTVCGPNHKHLVQDLDDIKDKTTGNWMFVKSINTSITPDANGNVNLPLPSGEGFIVASVDGIKPLTVEGNVVLGAVRGLQLGEGTAILRPDANGNINLGKIEGSVKTVNTVEPDEDGNVDLGDIVASVNDLAPDANGNVNIDSIVETKATSTSQAIVNTAMTTTVPQIVENYAAPIEHTHEHTDISDWSTATATFLDAADITTQGETVGLQYSGDYSVCGPNHGHRLDDIVDFDDSIENKLGEKFVNVATAQDVAGQKTFTSNINACSGLNLTNNSSIIFNNGSSGFIGNTALDGIGIKANDFFVIVPQNEAKLSNSPTQNAAATCIATVGWVRDNAVAPTQADVGYMFSNAGSVEYKNSTISQTLTVLTSATWDGTKLIFKRSNVEITQGLITNVTAASDQTIATTTYTGN